jgi:probable F420-dependent oxidoreductase
VRYAVALPQLGHASSGRAIKAAARQAEELGFADLWVNDHIAAPLDPFPGQPGLGPDSHAVWMYDPLQTAATAAAVTESIGIGVQVVAAYYPPVYLANALASLDSLSEGRLKVTVGVGWVPGEFAALGSDFRTRGRRTDEIIPILRACWDQPVAEYDGEFYQIPPLRILPTPAHRIPIWIAGTRRPAFRRAVRLGDGYHGQPTRRDVPAEGPMTSNSELRTIIGDLRRERADEETFTISVYTHEWDPAEVEDDVIRRERDYYIEIGVQHVVVALSRRTTDGWLRSVERLARILSPSSWM